MSSPCSFVLGIRAFDSSIRVECPSAEILETLNRYLFPPLPRSEPSASPDIDVHIENMADEFNVRLNGEPVAHTVTLRDAALATVKALDEAVVHRLRNFHPVHAGAVIVQGRALLLPGSTHAGKSSLVAELLRRGASHLSDEYALIDSEGRAHAYPRPLLLRNGQPRQSLVLPEELNSSFAAQPARVGWIIATGYVPGGGWKIQEISQSEAVMLLLRNTPHEMEQAPKMVDFFGCVAAHAACYQGSRGEVAEAAERIFELIGRK
jgi:hypothetical protein